MEIAVQEGGEGGWRLEAAGHGYEIGGESATGADPAMTWPGGVGPSEEATHVGKGAKHPAQPIAIARDSAVPLVTPTMTGEEQTKGGVGVQTQRERVAILREAVAAKAKLRGQAPGEASTGWGGDGDGGRENKMQVAACIWMNASVCLSCVRLCSHVPHPAVRGYVH